MAKGKTVLSICGKTVDRFTARLIEDGKVTRTHDGYVPEFMPNEHFGDYVELDIDIETGQILNWKKPTKAQLKAQLNNE
jgi:hypothetical protein